MRNPSLGRRIAKLRKARGMTQSELSAAIGAGGRSTIATIESGFRTPSLQVALDLADCFQVPLDYLLCRDTPLGGPLVGKFIEDPDVLALVRFWGSLTNADRDAVVRLLQIPTVDLKPAA